MLTLVQNMMTFNRTVYLYLFKKIMKNIYLILALLIGFFFLACDNTSVEKPVVEDFVEEPDEQVMLLSAVSGWIWLYEKHRNFDQCG